MTNNWKNSQPYAGDLSGLLAATVAHAPTTEGWDVSGAGRGSSMQPMWRGRAYELMDELMAEAAAERSIRGDRGGDGHSADGRARLGMATRLRIRLGRAMVSAGRTIAGPEERRAPVTTRRSHS